MDSLSARDQIAEIGPVRIPSISFSTEPLPPGDRFAAWAELAAPLAEITAASEEPPAFTADQVAWDMGRIALSHMRLPALGFRRTSRQLRADPIDHWVISCARRGRVRIAAEERSMVVTPDRATVHSLRTPFEGGTSGAELLTLFVPRDFCREAAARLDAAEHHELSGGLGRLLADYLSDLDRRLPLMTAAELPGLLAATHAIIVACIAPSRDSVAAAQSPIEATLLERARQSVRRNLFTPHFGSDELCRELGVSRSRLYRLFEPLGGVMHYIRGRRLLDAHSALSDANDGRSIVDIAAERGFYDAAEFSRAFKREFGYRPTDARRLPPGPGLRGESFDDGRSALGGLLRRLQ